MFQYAAGRALAQARGQPLLVDISGFGTYGLHQGYQLTNAFVLQVDAAPSAMIAHVLGWRANPLARKLLRRRPFAAWRGVHMAVEPHFHYWPDLANMEEPVYMTGYWQSERYFSHCENEIRNDFRFKNPLQGKNAQLAAAMTGGSSVSVHIRRGDYVTHKKTNKIMHVCSLDYYREAAFQLSQRVKQPAYYVFSDDPEWVREHVDFLPGAMFVDHNHGADSFLDMQLMSLCRHHIIANSSFSWWGAWLNADPDKIVYAPRAWFRNYLDDRDLIPARWNRI